MASLGPIDQTTSNFNAGVGAMWNPRAVRVHVASLERPQAKALENIGRLRKYVVQQIHGQAFAVCNIYGWTNAAKDKKANKATSNVLEELALDAQGHHRMP